MSRKCGARAELPPSSMSIALGDVGDDTVAVCDRPRGHEGNHSAVVCMNRFERRVAWRRGWRSKRTGAALQTRDEREARLRAECGQ